MTSLIPDDNVRIMWKTRTVRSVIKLIHCGNLLRKGWNHGGMCVRQWCPGYVPLYGYVIAGLWKLALDCWYFCWHNYMMSRTHCQQDCSHPSKN